MKTILLVSLILLVGCGSARVCPQPLTHAEVGTTLISIGLYFTWAGAAAIGLGILGGIACTFFPAIALFRGYLAELAAIGIATLLLGCSFIWLGNHAWLMAVVVGLLLSAVCFRYRNRLGKLLGLPKNKPQALKQADPIIQ